VAHEWSEYAFKMNDTARSIEILKLSDASFKYIRCNDLRLHNCSKSNYCEGVSILVDGFDCKFFVNRFHHAQPPSSARQNVKPVTLGRHSHGEH